jgi:hypothetical protein
MSSENIYGRAKDTFEQLNIGESISCKELAEKIGVTTYEKKKKVAAFLSQYASRGRVRKYLGPDQRMYYEKISPPKRARSRRAAPKEVPASHSVITFGEIGEGIVRYIDRLTQQISDLERERDYLKERLSMFSKQKDEFKHLYQDAERRLKEMSAKRPVSPKTIRLSKVIGEPNQS